MHRVLWMLAIAASKALVHRSWHPTCLCAAFAAIPRLLGVAMAAHGPAIWGLQVGASVCGSYSNMILMFIRGLVCAGSTAGGSASLTKAVGPCVCSYLCICVAQSLRSSWCRHPLLSDWQVVMDRELTPRSGCRLAPCVWFLFGRPLRWKHQPRTFMFLQPCISSLNSLQQAHLLHLSKHTVQVPRLVHGILHMQAIAMPSLQLLKHGLVATNPLPEANRNDLLSPRKLLAVELKETEHHLPKRERTVPGAAGCLDLLLYIGIPILLKKSNRKHHELDLWVNLHEVDGHQGQCVGRQVRLGCTANFVGLCPELHCNHEIPNPFIQA
mmetsp:Transcript_40667/g.63912  ORF Transcript_40667/g.63912 Transcript_40667/m.63912 type:complete len:326 (-) Transcript_40667:637-1614(-)